MEQFNEAKPRTRRTQQQIGELLAEFDRENYTVKEFCHLKGVNQGVFHKWKSRRKNNSSLTDKPSGFAKMQVQPWQAGQLFAEVKGIRFYQVVSATYLKELIG
jgi:hypothetical protein